MVQNVFAVHNTSGTVALLRPLDYERNSKHSFVVFAMDGGTPQRTGSAMVDVSVQNVNEFSPEFVGLPYEFWVEEGASRGTRVGQIEAKDGDGDRVTYSLSAGGGSEGGVEYFSVDAETGQLYVRRDLDAPRTHYTFVVRATDDGLPSNHTIGVKATVHVKERNDYPPVFTQLTYHGALKEKDATGRPLVKVEAVDKDFQNNTVTYSLRGGNDENIFEVHATSGEIRALPDQAYKLDYERKNQYSLLVQAKDSHVQPLSGLAMVIIDILDINDHPPTFSQASYSATLEENLPPGHCFLQISANSGDTIDMDAITYSISTNNLPFTVHPKSGEICTKESLDREVRENYEFMATASDSKFHVKAPVTVRVLDENDNPPRFEKERYIVSVPPLAQGGRVLLQVHATDPDIANNGAVTYWIKNSHGLFEVDSQSGEVRLSGSLPPSTPQNSTYEMEIFARDQGTASNFGRAMLIVRVSSAPNRPPRFPRLAYYAVVEENVADVPLALVEAEDPDVGPAGTLKYRIIRTSGRREAFRMDPDTGMLTLVSSLDYEVDQFLELSIEARDTSKEPQFATVIVQFAEEGLVRKLLYIINKQS
ncbi:hypothetical protein LAZ67_9002570 [Cordylochernes scorpioides]|uniref:Cadherin domain-containing protein n=1 Tax=Cordylochernes scorpioides TaxID=51811 RepID=A0ABY6KUE4_9ARAC|nr:hypothetical protein LAZ67_9002570 [Cordylochernes scorpioides]